MIAATALVETLRTKARQELPEVDKPIKGSDLVDRRYQPPFDYFYKSSGELDHDSVRLDAADGGILLHFPAIGFDVVSQCDRRGQRRQDRQPVLHAAALLTSSCALTLCRPAVTASICFCKRAMVASCSSIR